MATPHSKFCEGDVNYDKADGEGPQQMLKPFVDMLVKACLMMPK